MKRSPLRRRAHRKPAEVIERELWRDNLGGCVMRYVTPCEGKVRGHHVIAKSTLRNRGLAEFVWDRRNRMALCDRHHRRHHSRHEPVPFLFVSKENRAFARDVDLEYLIERYYPKGGS